MTTYTVPFTVSVCYTVHICLISLITVNFYSIASFIIPCFSVTLSLLPTRLSVPFVPCRILGSCSVECHFFGTMPLFFCLIFTASCICLHPISSCLTHFFFKKANSIISCSLCFSLVNPYFLLTFKVPDIPCLRGFSLGTKHAKTCTLG